MQWHPFKYPLLCLRQSTITNFEGSSRGGCSLVTGQSHGQSVSQSVVGMNNRMLRELVICRKPKNREGNGRTTMAHRGFRKIITRANKHGSQGNFTAITGSESASLWYFRKVFNGSSRNNEHQKPSLIKHQYVTPSLVDSTLALSGSSITFL